MHRRVRLELLSLVQSQDADQVNSLLTSLQMAVCSMDAAQRAANQVLEAHIDNGFASIKEGDTDELARKELFDRLHYPEYLSREGEVSEAYQSTFEWIFRKRFGNSQPWADFPKWLRKDTGTYWIHGKPASGKSTLMSFIRNHQKTQDLLQLWSHGKHVVTLAYFFWRQGAVLQRKTEGLLRSLLLQILDEKSLTRESNKWLRSANGARLWTSAIMQSAMLDFLKNSECCYFIMIDGLDEFDEDPESLVALCFEVEKLPNVKLCVSSRPEILLERQLKNCEQLRVQDLTRGDIHAFVSGTLQQYANSAPIIREIEADAEGVFLWVNIVTNSMVKGLKLHDDLDLLMQRLKAFPRELTGLYHHILLDRVDPIYRETLALYFYILKLHQEGAMPEPTLLLLTCITNDVKATSCEHFWNLCGITRDHILDRSQHILQLTKPRRNNKAHYPVCASSAQPWEGQIERTSLRTCDACVPRNKSQRLLRKTDVQSVVGFVHRTAFEFLFEQAPGQQFLLEAASSAEQRQVQILRGLATSLLSMPLCCCGQGNSFDPTGCERPLADRLRDFLEFVSQAPQSQHVMTQMDQLCDRFAEEPRLLDAGQQLNWAYSSHNISRDAVFIAHCRGFRDLQPWIRSRISGWQNHQRLPSLCFAMSPLTDSPSMTKTFDDATDSFYAMISSIVTSEWKPHSEVPEVHLESQHYRARLSAFNNWYVHRGPLGEPDAQVIDFLCFAVRSWLQIIYVNVFVYPLNLHWVPNYLMLVAKIADFLAPYDIYIDGPDLLKRRQPSFIYISLQDWLKFFPSQASQRPCLGGVRWRIRPLLLFQPNRADLSSTLVLQSEHLRLGVGNRLYIGDVWDAHSKSDVRATLNMRGTRSQFHEVVFSITREAEEKGQSAQDTLKWAKECVRNVWLYSL